MACEPGDLDPEPSPPYLTAEDESCDGYTEGWRVGCTPVDTCGQDAYDLCCSYRGATWSPEVCWFVFTGKLETFVCDVQPGGYGPECSDAEAFAAAHCASLD